MRYAKAPPPYEAYRDGVCTETMNTYRTEAMKDLVLDNEGARIAGQMQQIGEAMQQLVTLL